MKNLLFLLLICLVGTVNADTYTWTGSSSINWNDSSNWSPASVPGSADIASFTNTSTTYQPKLDTTRSIAGLTVSANISLDLNTFQLTVNGNTTLDRGTFSNGSLTVNGTTVSLGYMNQQGTVYYGPTLSCSLTATAATLSIKFSTFNEAVVLTKTGSSADQWQGGNTFNGTVSMTNSGSGLLNPGFRGVNTYNAAVSLYNQSGGTIGFSQTANIGSDAPYCYINADLNLSNTGSGEINLGRNAATYYSSAKTIRMASGTRIRVVSPGFSAGTLHIENLRQEAADSLAFALSGTALLRIASSQIKGITVLSAPNLQTSSNSYDLALTFTVSNGNNSNSWGGNQFSGPVTLNHSGASGFSWAIGGSDYFSSTLTLNLSGAGAFGIASGILTGTPTTFSDHVYVNNTGGGGGFIIGTYRTNPSNPQLAVFAADKRVVIGSGGFSSGTLKMERTTFNGSSPWSLALGGTTTTLYLGDNLITNQAFTASAPNIVVSGSTFNQSLELTKTGNSTNEGYAGSTYNGPAVFNINGTGHLGVGVITKDQFNSDLTVNTTSSGGFYTGNNAASEILGNISYSRSGTGFLQLGYLGGGIQFKGSSDQSFYATGTGSGEARFYKPTINKSSGKLKLYGDANVFGNMVLTSGIVQNNGGMVHFRAGSSVSGASDASYIEGATKKTGNTAFTFPLGGGGRYNPLAITAPSSAGDAFTAEFISGSANASYSLSSKESSLDQMDEDGYWKLARSSGSSTPTLTLNWHSLKCGVTSPSTLSFAQWDAATGTWLNKGNAANTSSSLTHSGSLAFSSTPIPFVLGNIRKMAANAGPDTSFCAGGSVGLSASGSYGTTPFTYAWLPATGLSSSAVANPTASPASAATYTVTVTDARGCTASDTMVVSVNELPVADAGSDTTIYAGDTVQIGAVSISGNTYVWEPIESLSNSLVSNPMAFPEYSTLYIVNATNDKGCQGLDEISINVLPLGYSTDNPIIFGNINDCNNSISLLAPNNWIEFQLDSDVCNISILLNDLTNSDFFLFEKGNLTDTLINYHFPTFSNDTIFHFSFLKASFGNRFLINLKNISLNNFGTLCIAGNSDKNIVAGNGDYYLYDNGELCLDGQNQLEFGVPLVLCPKQLCMSLASSQNNHIPDISIYGTHPYVTLTVTDDQGQIIFNQTQLVNNNESFGEKVFCFNLQPNKDYIASFDYFPIPLLTDFQNINCGPLFNSNQPLGGCPEYCTSSDGYVGVVGAPAICNSNFNLPSNAYCCLYTYSTDVIGTSNYFISTLPDVEITTVQVSPSTICQDQSFSIGASVNNLITSFDYTVTIEIYDGQNNLVENEVYYNTAPPFNFIAGLPAGNYQGLFTVSQTTGGAGGNTTTCECSSDSYPFSFEVKNESIELEATDLSICLNESFVGQINLACFDPSSIVSYEWDFGDGTIVSGTNLTTNSHNYSSAGTYTVKVKAFYTNIGDYFESQIDVNVYNLPPNSAVTITGNIYSCPSSSTYSIPSFSSMLYTAVWTITGGTITSGQSSNQISVTWNNNTTGGNVSVTLTSIYSCSISSEIEILPCCIPNVSNLTQILPNQTSSSLGTNALSGNISINGTFIVDNDFSFNLAEVWFGPDSKIELVGSSSNPVLFLVSESYLHGCSLMWDFIEADNSHETIRISRNSIIEDAENAVKATNNGKFEIVQSYFNKNHIDIFANNSTATGSFVEGSTFLCQTDYSDPTPAGLKPPRLDEKTFAHMRFRNVDLQIIGSTTTTNTFNTGNYGILSEQCSRMYIKNCKFDNLGNSGENGLFLQGGGIMAEGGYYSGSSSIDITDLCEFTNCITGIYAGTYMSLKADDNRFYSCTKGIISAFNRESDIIITNNQMSTLANDNDMVNGIISYENNFSDIQIGMPGNYNTIDFSNNDTLDRAVGILAVEATNTNWLSNTSGITDYKVEDNEITDAFCGIWGMNLNGNFNLFGTNPSKVQVRNNKIQVKNTVSSNRTGGILMQNSVFPMIAENEIWSNSSTNGYWANGIVEDLGQASILKCNNTHDIGRGLFINGGNRFLNLLLGNTMEDIGSDGLVLNYSDIGNQYNLTSGGRASFDNTWSGSFSSSNPQILSYGLGYISNQTTFSVIGTATSPNPNTKYPVFRNNLSGAYVVPNPNAVPGQASAIFDYACSSRNGLEIETEELKNRMYAIISDSTTNITDIQKANRWSGTYAIFRSLKNDTLLSPGDSILEPLMDSLQASNMNLLHFAIMVNGVKTVSKQSLVDSAIAAIDTMTAIGKTEEALRQILLLSLSYKSDTLLPDSADASTIQAIAGLCPLEYGQGVYIARAWATGLNNFKVVNYHPCENVPEPAYFRMEENQGQNVQGDVTVKLFPNPGKGELNVLFNGTKEVEGYLEIHSAMGTVVQKYPLHATYSKLQLDLSNGLYLYRISTNTFQEVGKILLVK